MIVLLPGNHAFNFKVLTPSQSSTIHKNICLNLLLNIGIQTFVKSIHLMTLTADNTKHITSTYIFSRNGDSYRAITIFYAFLNYKKSPRGHSAHMSLNSDQISITVSISKFLDN